MALLSSDVLAKNGYWKKASGAFAKVFVGKAYAYGYVHGLPAIAEKLYSLAIAQIMVKQEHGLDYVLELDLVGNHTNLELRFKVLKLTVAEDKDGFFGGRYVREKYSNECNLVDVIAQNLGLEEGQDLKNNNWGYLGNSLVSFDAICYVPNKEMQLQALELWGLSV